MKPEPIYRQIGGVIRGLRRRADKPQEQVARELGISRATLANIETGRQRILVHQLYAIAQALNVKVADLLPTPKEEMRANWAALNFEGELSAEQKQQLANLIGTVDAPKAQGETNAKATATRRDAGSQRTKAAR